MKSRKQCPLARVWFLGLVILMAGCRPRCPEAERDISAPTPVASPTAAPPPPVAGPAGGWSVTASSVQTPDEWSRAANAIDGNRDTRWSSALSDSQWLKIDLGAVRELAGLRVYWETAYASAYEIQTSLDGERWETAYSTTNGDGGEDEVWFQSRTARWVRIECSKRGTDFGYSIWELETEAPGAEPLFTASSARPGNEPVRLLSAGTDAGWHSVGSTGEWLQIDFRRPRVFGRLLVNWGPDFARAFDVAVSDDGRDWRHVYSQDRAAGGATRVYFEKSTGQYVRIECRESGTGNGVEIRRVEVGMPDEAVTLQKFFEIASARAPGCYPRWMSDQQAFWTVVGVADDDKESIFCEDGTIEHHKRGFTVMPLLYVDDQLVTRDQAVVRQSLQDNVLPIPSVDWAVDGLNMDITMLAGGKAGQSSTYTQYRIHNDREVDVSGSLFLLLRPFQLYPPWQGEGEGENEAEGKGKGGLTYVSSIRRTGEGLDISDKYHISLLTQPSGFGTLAGKPALRSPCRDVLVDDLQQGLIPSGGDVTNDPDRFSSAVLRYDFALEPGDSRDIYVAMPLHETSPELTVRMGAVGVEEGFERILGTQVAFWETKVNPIEIAIPEPGFTETLKANIGYTFITKDGPWLQPGTWCYDKSWIRDGGIAAVALMRLGFFKEARAFIDLYTTYQLPTGEIPCVIDNKAKNPFWENISEYDSQGQYIYAVLQYYEFTRDLAFLQGKLTNVVKALRFAEELRSRRTTAEYRDDPDKKLMYGLISKSYANHNYYDNLWTLKAWNDGMSIARILGRDDLVEWMGGQYIALRDSVYASMTGAMKKHGIDYIPEYPEGTHFWASSIAAGVSHCGELANMPQPALGRTMDKYYEEFQSWQKPGAVYRFTPEEMPIAETFLYMGHKDRAIKFLRFMLAHRKPIGWKQWPEVVNSDERRPTIFGDMPHTWVSAQYISALMSLFLYEKRDALVLAAGIPEEWVLAPGGVELRGVATHFGKCGLRLTGTKDQVDVRLTGDLRPPGWITLVSPMETPLRGVRVNGQEWKDFSAREVRLPSSPANVTLLYGDPGSTVD